MTLKQLKRKYLAEGKRLGYKKALNEMVSASIYELADQISQLINFPEYDFISYIDTQVLTKRKLEVWIESHTALPESLVEDFIAEIAEIAETNDITWKYMRNKQNRVVTILVKNIS